MKGISYLMSTTTGKTDMSKLREEAEAFLAEARRLGYEASIDGDWVVWSPRPPADFLLRALQQGLAAEIAGLLTEAAE